MLYVFDEPTIGLHPRDTRTLIAVLRRLRDLGNTVLVIEHDLEMIAAADYVIDFGPGGGKHGGQVMAAGSPAEVQLQAGSLTGAYLAGGPAIPLPERRRESGKKAITIRGAASTTCRTSPCACRWAVLVAVTGVSGSGKSTLVFDILDRACARSCTAPTEAPGAHASIEGWEHLDKVITIDQEHIGRMPRSNVATYSDVFTPIRAAFAATPTAKQMGTDRPPLLVQRAGRALRTLRGHGRAGGPDALPARRRGALPGLRRAALHREDPAGTLPRPGYLTGAGPDRRRGAGAV